MALHILNIKIYYIIYNTKIKKSQIYLKKIFKYNFKYETLLNILYLF